MSSKKRMSFFCKKVYETVKRIPKGKAATYRAVAEAINRPKAGRAVGNALARNRDARVPCHRVIPSHRGIGGFAWGREKKKKLLQHEGVYFDRDGRIHARSIVQIPRVL